MLELDRSRATRHAPLDDMMAEIMAQSASQRLTRKAGDATGKPAVGQFLTEAVVLTGIGGLIGRQRPRDHSRSFTFVPRQRQCLT